MNHIRVFLAFVVVVLFSSISAYAQHTLEMDDGSGHYTKLSSQTVNALDVFTFPAGGGTIATNATVWSLKGNAGTNPASNPLTVNLTTNHFIGTTDNKELDFITNGAIRARFKQSTGDTITSGAFEPGIGNTYSLGSMDRPWKGLYVTPGTITFTSSTGAHKPGDHTPTPTVVNSGTLSFDETNNKFIFDRPLGFSGAGSSVTTSTITITGLASTYGGMVRVSPGGVLEIADSLTDYQKPMTAGDGISISSNKISLGGSFSNDVNISGNSKNLYLTNPGDFGIGTASATTGLLEVQCSTKTAFRALAAGSSGSAGIFDQNNASNANHTLIATTPGTGNALDASTSGSGWAGHFDGSGGSSKGVYASGGAGQTGLQINNGSVIVSHTDQGVGAFAVGAGTNGVVAIDNAGAGAGFNITLNTGTNGQIINIYNGNATQTATFVGGTSLLHAQNTGGATIAPGKTVTIIFVTTSTGSGWITK